jgi:threonine synthase
VRLALVFLVVATLGCKKEEAAPVDTDTAPPIPAAEVKRGKDACTAYVTQVCACTAEPAKQACALAKALPEAIEVGMQVALSPDSKRREVLQANDSIRKTFKECIEQAAKLPALGC